MRPLVAGSGFLFASGFCALVYQTVWLRELRSILGASTPATSAVLALFMGGLGFGALFIGRRVDRHPSPLVLYGTLELLIAGLAAVSPFLLDAARAAYLGIGGSLALGVFATPVRVLLAAVVMLAPALLMGGTLPAMARALLDGADHDRRTLALVYGTNTLGAVAGVLATSFVFFEVFGLRATLWLAAGGNALLGFIARSRGRRQPVTPAPSPTSPASSVRDRAILAAAFVAGFAFLVFELVWYRLMAPVLGGTTYSFSVILAMCLLGIGLGGVLYAFAPPRVSWRTLGLTCWLEALFLLGPFAVGDDFLFFAFHLREFASASFGLLVGSWVAMLAWFVLPAAIVSGYQFPLLIALVSHDEHLGADTGRVYAANTVGAIIGSLCGGLLLIPTLGAHTTGVVAAVLLAVVGTLSVWREGGTPVRAIVMVVVGATALVAASARGPGVTWAVTATGAGRAARPPATMREREMHHRTRASLLVNRSEGLESTVAVTGHDGYSLLVNGKSDGNSAGDAETQIGATLLAALLRREPVRTAFVIGLGTGQSAGWLASVPGVDHVDVAEIEPAVADYARLCHDTNFHVLDNPKVRLLIGDGRELTQVSQGGFDLIMSEPSNPYRAGLAGFYSSDFYAVAREKLAPGGILVQWMQAYEVEASTVQTAVATLKDAFPHVLIWRLGTGDLVFMASSQQISIDADVVNRRLDEEPFRTAFRRIFLFEDATDVFSLFVGGDRLASVLQQGWNGGLNTDDLPLLEFSFARSVGQTGTSQLPPLAELAGVLGATRPEGLTGTFDTGRAGLVLAAKLDLFSTGDRFEGLTGPLGLLRRALAADASDDDVEALEAVLPTEAAAVRLLRAGAGEQARPLIAPFVERLRADPWLTRALSVRVGVRLVSAAEGGGEDVARHLRTPFPGGRLEAFRREALLLSHLGNPTPACVADFDALPPPWNPALMQARADCFGAHARTRAPLAEADLERYRAGEPATFLVPAPSTSDTPPP